MKIILSRKGFDSSRGGKPSPIFEDGTLLSLLIPDEESTVPFAKLRPRGIEIGDIVQDLTKGRVSRTMGAHLDPDLERSTIQRSPNWLPNFGQSGAAQKHLANQGVGIGDLFLFFGWFHRVERVNEHYRYAKGAPDVHAIFGWLPIGKMLNVDRDLPPQWLKGHPHLQGRSPSPNVIYIADRPEAGGIFDEFHIGRQLTAEGHGRSYWRLPGWFFPCGGHSLSYHRHARRWKKLGGDTLLHTVGRGQEFVLDCDHFPEALEWIRKTVGCKA